MSSVLQRVVAAMQTGASVIRRVIQSHQSSGASSNDLSLCSVQLSDDLESLTFVKEDQNLVSHLQLSGVTELVAVDEAEAPAIAMTVVTDSGRGTPGGQFKLQIIFPAQETRDIWFAGLAVLTEQESPKSPRDDRKSPEISDQYLLEENRKLRRLLQARDATIADLMAMVENLIGRQQALLEDFAEEEPAQEEPRASDEEETLRRELEAKIAALEEKKARLESLLEASKEALEGQLA